MEKICGKYVPLIPLFYMFQLLHKNSNRRAYPMVIEDDYVAHGLKCIAEMQTDVEYFPSIWQYKNDNDYNIEYSGQYEISTLKSLYDRMIILKKRITQNYMK